MTVVAAVPEVAATPPRLLELDALRGLAALAVLAFHWFDRYPRVIGGGTPLAGAWIGQYGVDLFFIISGFVILMTLERSRTVADFALSRLVRLYPAYWAAVLCTTAVVAIGGLPGREVGWGATAANLLMVHGWAGVPDVDGVYWTLGIEMGFYLLMLGARSAGLLPRLELALLAWLALAGGVQLAVAHGWTALPVKLTKAVLLVPYAPCFVLGCALYRWRHGRFPRLALAVAMAALAVFVLIKHDAEALVLVVSAAAVVAAISGYLRWLAWRPLLLLGVISYPLYLVHQNIGYVLMLHLEGAGLGHGAAAAIALVVVLALATAITRGVEQPAREALRRRRALSRAATARSGVGPTVHPGTHDGAAASNPAAAAGRAPD